MRVRGWLPPLLWAGVIVFATSMPTTFVPTQLSPFDKVIHFGMYGVFAALLTRRLVATASLTRAATMSVVIGVSFGALDEWHQRFIPGRSTELADWVADSLGVAVGVAALILYVLWKSRKVAAK